VPADAISVPADSAAAVVKFTVSIPREWCTNAKAKYSSRVVPPDPSVHFYHRVYRTSAGLHGWADVRQTSAGTVAGEAGC